MLQDVSRLTLVPSALFSAGDFEVAQALLLGVEQNSHRSEAFDLWLAAMSAAVSGRPIEAAMGVA